MAEENNQKSTANPSPKKKKALWKVILDWVFGIFIVTIIAVEGYGLLTAKNNYNVPNFFGYQIMHVLTDSMEKNYKDDSSIHEYPVGDGVIVKKVDFSLITSTTFTKNGQEITFYGDSKSSIKADQYLDSNDNPVHYPSNNSLSYESSYPGDNLDGSVIAYYSTILQQVVTHRVMEIDCLKSTDGTSTYYFYTRGDNLNAQTCPEGGCSRSYRDSYTGISQEYVLGVVVGDSLALGTISKLSTEPWFVLLLVLVPLSLIVVFSAIDFIKALKMKPEEETDKKVEVETVSHLYLPRLHQRGY